MRHAGGQATTLSIDRILFKEPIRVGELVEVRSRVVHVGRRSMSVLANVYAENIATVSVGTRTSAGSPSSISIRRGKPAAVPPLRLETEEDRDAARLAAERREASLAERASNDGRGRSRGTPDRG